MARAYELYIDHKFGLTRMAYFEGSEIVDLCYELNDKAAKVGDIYYAKILRIIPSMQAAFVDIGEDVAGFLPKKNLRPLNNLAIEKQIHEGQFLVLQVTQVARGQGRHRKGATLTNDVNLSSASVVYLPHSVETSVVLSNHLRKTCEIEDKRAEIEAKLVAQNISGQVILRSRAFELIENINDDLDSLLNRWKKVQDSIKRSKTVQKFSSEGSIIRRQLSIKLKDVETLIASNHRSMIECKKALDELGDCNLPELKVADIDDDFYASALKETEARALSELVDLPSGGTLIFDETEAMTVVDVNTASGSGDRHAQQTANLEAATELARQLRLRDISGIVIIDFINTQSSQHHSEVLALLRDQLVQDWNKTTCEAASKLGLVEVTRLRTGLSLSELMLAQCECCKGTGMLKSEHAVAIQVIEELEAGHSNEQNIEVIATPKVIELLKSEMSKSETFSEFKNWRFRESRELAHGDYDLKLGRGV